MPTKMMSRDEIIDMRNFLIERLEKLKHLNRNFLSIDISIRIETLNNVLGFKDDNFKRV